MKRILFIIGIFVIIGGISWIAIRYAHTSSSSTLDFVVPTPTPDPLAPKNILLLGYGGGKHDGGLLTDTMIVAHIIPKQQEIVLISIPRDLWVSLPLTADGVHYKINAAFAYGSDTTQYPDRPKNFTGTNGGGALAGYAVTQMTGLPIDGYVAVSFDGFKNAFNILGPISVDVPFSFTDMYYPIDGKEKDVCGVSEEEQKQRVATLSGDLLERAYSCRFETFQMTKGVQQMDADTALKFVRSRHSDVNGNDFGRSLRQMAFIKGVVNKLKTLGGLAKLPSFLTRINTFLMTDIDAQQVIQIATTYGDPFSYSIKTVELTVDNALVASNSATGQFILVPKEDGSDHPLKNFIDTSLEQLDASSSASPTAVPTR